MIGTIVHNRYTAEIHTLTEDRATGILHKHYYSECDRVLIAKSRPFNVKVKNGKFTTNVFSNAFGSINEYFNVAHIKV